jgi:putative thioredoxin
MAQPSPWIVETTQQDFQRDVIDRSSELPVVVDFWAAWCQPCRMLGPVLEKLADEFQGRFVLVKADTDQMPNIASGFGVQSIPSVFAFRDGNVVDQFVGVLPEPDLRVWLEGLLPNKAQELAAEAKMLEAANPAVAEARYKEAISLQPSEASARLGLARMLLSQQRLEEAQEAIRDLASAGALDAEGEQLQAELKMQLEAQQAGSVDECRRAAESAPDDLLLKLGLARALAAAGEYQEAMDICLALIQKDRSGHGEKARELMVHIFHLLVSETELAGDYRRKLTMVLY